MSYCGGTRPDHNQQSFFFPPFPPSPVLLAAPPLWGVWSCRAGGVRKSHSASPYCCSRTTPLPVNHFALSYNIIAPPTHVIFGNLSSAFAQLTPPLRIN